MDETAGTGGWSSHDDGQATRKSPRLGVGRSRLVDNRRRDRARRRCQRAHDLAVRPRRPRRRRRDRRCSVRPAGAHVVRPGHELQALEHELTEMQAVNHDLQGEVDRLQTDDGIREAAREELGHIQSGDNRQTMLELPPLPPTSPTAGRTPRSGDHAIRASLAAPPTSDAAAPTATAASVVTTTTGLRRRRRRPPPHRRRPPRDRRRPPSRDRRPLSYGRQQLPSKGTSMRSGKATALAIVAGVVIGLTAGSGSATSPPPSEPGDGQRRTPPPRREPGDAPGDETVAPTRGGSGSSPAATAPAPTGRVQLLGPRGRSGQGRVLPRGRRGLLRRRDVRVHRRGDDDCTTGTSRRRRPGD